jgi:hypothetical protein
MEKVTLKWNQGLFSVEEIVLESDKEHVYVCFVSRNPKQEWELSFGFAQLDDKERIYLSVMDEHIQQAVKVEALPLLLNALEIKTLQSDSPEEQVAYKNAVEELTKLGKFSG